MLFLNVHHPFNPFHASLYPLLVNSCRVIVTGGCGFIGSNLVERLVGDGHEVIVFDNLLTGNLRSIKGVMCKVL
ncbi:MAG: NAD-dependent epimerase/dehydratase family protein [Candidatus Bathyarchaeia archaeon]